MITLDVVFARFATLREDDLRRWIGEGHVRADRDEGALVFQEIDVERIRLILELREVMAVNDEALPVILSLLDQLYELRRRLQGHDAPDR